jgi:hypothetical protein
MGDLLGLGLGEVLGKVLDEELGVALGASLGLALGSAWGANVSFCYSDLQCRSLLLICVLARADVSICGSDNDGNTLMVASMNTVLSAKGC